MSASVMPAKAGTYETQDLEVAAYIHACGCELQSARAEDPK